jgi:predicted kinase
MKREIVFCLGLPGSGKSTFAKKWVEEDPVNRVRINKDDLRLLLHQNKYSKANEKQILEIEESIIINSLKRGKSIVLDNTHLATDRNNKNKHLTRILDLIHEHGYVVHFPFKCQHEYVQVTIKDFTHITPEECIINDLKRENSVGQNVIWEMYWNHIAIVESCSTSNLNKDGIIVDVDGTLATMYNRSPFDWSKVGNDKIRSHIRTLVNVYKNSGYKIIIVSGRNEVCKEQTIDWLISNDVLFDDIYMRPANDNRKDYIIKREIYYRYIKPNYNIHLVVDDRPQVIREWRRLGLNIINANPKDKEF